MCTEDSFGAYGAAGAVTMEVTGLIRIFIAYNSQKLELIRYEVAVEKAYRSNGEKEMGYISIFILDLLCLSFFVIIQ